MWTPQTFLIMISLWINLVWSFIIMETPTSTSTCPFRLGKEHGIASQKSKTDTGQRVSLRQRPFPFSSQMIHVTTCVFSLLLGCGYVAWHPINWKPHKNMAFNVIPNFSIKEQQPQTKRELHFISPVIHTVCQLLHCTKC